LLGYDAVAVETIPSNAGLVFYYDEPSTLGPVQQLFPNAAHIGITTQGAGGPNWRLCDMETGDLTAAQAAQWAYNQIHGGMPVWMKPTIYCQSANVQAVFDACAAIGLKLGAFTDPTADVWWFMAWWNGVPNLVPPPPPWWQPPQPVGHQFHTVYDAYDVDVCLEGWVFLAPPAPPPVLKEVEDFMFVRSPVTVTDASGHVIQAGEICLCSAAGAVNLGNNWSGILADYAAANIPVVLHDSQTLLERFTTIALH
jgi:hypothetical protein